MLRFCLHFKKSQGIKEAVADKELSWIPLSKAWHDALKLPGFPRGYVSSVRGYTNTGKSTAFYEAIAGAQRIGDLPVIYETEGNFNWDHAKTCGVQFDEEVNEETGEIKELRCTYDPDTKSGSGTNNRKVKGTLHWVSAQHAVDAEVRQYDRLFNDPDPAGHKDKDFKEFLNEDSLEVIKTCKVEPSLAEAKPEDRFQFQRLGYFCTDRKDSKPGNLVFNRTVPLKDSWAKMNKK
jgi:hypothetical protein